MELETYFIISCIINLVLLLVLAVKSKNYHCLGKRFDALYSENSQLIGRQAGLKSNIQSLKDQISATADETNAQLLRKTQANKDMKATNEELLELNSENDRKISKLKEKTENQVKIITGCQKTIDKQSAEISQLKKDLAQSQKNDSPKDPETGKFTKKKAPAKKKAKKTTKK